MNLTTDPFSHYAKRSGVLFVVTILSISSMSTIQAQTTSFTRTLKVGDSGSDVLALQKILNGNTTTRVAASGPGAPGSETTYFGSLTSDAVARFQELHAAEILTPIGLTSGTGIVGEKTRQKLNALGAAKAAATPASPAKPRDINPTGLTLPATTGSEMYITSPSKYYGPPGTSIVLSGAGFTRSGNTLHFGSSLSIKDLGSADTTFLTFTVPSTIPYGKYILSLENANGTSTHNTFFVITDPQAQAPVITKVTPASGAYGQQITITGKNFTPTDNDIISNYGDIKGIASSDGTTLTFTIAPFSNIPEFQPGVTPVQNLDVLIYFYVLNKNGLSDEKAAGKFTMKI